MHDKVIEDTHGELHRSNEEGSGETVFKERERSAAVQGIEQSEDETAGETHGPVGIATAGNFYESVEEKAHKEGEERFVGFHGNTSKRKK